MLDPVSAGGATTKTSAAKKADESSPEAIQERFMALLVAQLKNQDPLSPMDNAAVTSQMAQLNTVTGINNLNSTMESMANTFTSGQALQATNMLGRTVMVEGNQVNLTEGQAPGSFELKQTADSVKVNVLSSSGSVIRTIDSGALGKGVHEFNWDGKNNDGQTVANGTYKFEVVASAAGKEAEVVTLTTAQVQGVRNESTGALLLTSNGREVSLSDVKQIF
ncbi:MAG: flagellar hook assembly protein FlgD [Limnobacter sp.]|nr:flagellar hook assembly protein FlgD [Limnobacter sp.]